MRRGDRFLFLVLTAVLMTVVAFAAFWERSILPPALTPVPSSAPSDTFSAGRTTAPVQTSFIVQGTAAPQTAKPERTPIPASPLKGKLRITEIMVKNRALLCDEDGDFPDWIELTNVSEEPIDLTGFRITDREKHYGWILPEKSLEPGGRLVLYASKKDRAGDELHTNFALSEKDCICLYDANGLPVDSAFCADTAADVSLALDAADSWQQTFYPTPGEENSAAGYERFQLTLQPRGPLVISEAAVKNLGLNVAGTDSDCDWVEIKNVSDRAVLLSDYYLSDKVDLPFLWQMPDQELAPGAALLFVCADPGSGFYGSTPCTGFSLNASNEQLYLTRGDGERIDWASLRDIPAGGSCGRMDGDAGWFFFAEPSPEHSNGSGSRRVSAMPVNLTPDGVFEDTEHVMLELRGEGELHYTINGSAPTKDSPLYTEPIEIAATSVVSVKSFEENALPSRTLSLSFIVNEGHTLPVASFVAEDKDAFTGIYNAGAKLYELPGTLSFYRGDESFRINCGIKLNGETSLVLPKKNLAVKFSGAYGAPTLEHDIFGGGVTSFTDLLLRAGQDQYQGIVRNELAQKMAEQADTAVINQRSIYCVLYLNGEYTGIYTVKERPNASLYAGLAGVDEDYVECIEAPAAYNSELYEQTVGFVNSHDMTLEENYAQFCQTMDIDSLIDWLILEGYCANTDVTSGNLRYARSSLADGKWHLLFYDLDAAFRSFESIQSNLLNDYGASQIQVASFSVPLMKNAQFREKFLTRAAELLAGPLSNKALLKELDAMAEELRPEVKRDYERVGSSLKSWENSIADLRSMIDDKDWEQANIDGLCSAFELDTAERTKYFGPIDKLAAEKAVIESES